MATKLIDSGTVSTQDLTNADATAGTVASDTTVLRVGSRSWKLSTGAGAVTASFTFNTRLADAGRRITFLWKWDTTPAAEALFCNLRNVGDTASIFQLSQTTANKLKGNPVGATTVTGATVWTVGTVYRISISYFVTNTTTFGFKVYVDGVLEITCTAGTLTNTGTSGLRFLANAAIGANANAWFGHIWVDDGASSGSQPDTPDVRTTAKRIFSNGTTNNFTTQIGSGGSGYGTGHAPQVNEQPLSTTNGWSVIGAGSAVTEEYNVEGESVGDVDVADVTIVDWGGQAYAKVAAGTDSAQLVVGGVNNAITVTSSYKMFTAYSGLTTYPTGTGADVGLVTGTAVTTESFADGCVLIAYAAAPETIYTQLERHGHRGAFRGMLH